MSLQKKIPIIHYLDPSSCGLPNGWIVEERHRISPKTSKRSDKYYYEPETRKKFRSLKAALEHLERKKKDDVKKLQELPNSKSKTKKMRIESSNFANAPKKDDVEEQTMEVTYLDGTLVQSTTESSASQDIISPHLSVTGKKGKGKTVLASPLCIIEDKLLAYVFSELDSSETLVDYDQDHGMRSDFNTLLPHNWVVDTIINLVAYQLNTREKEYKGQRMTRSYLPTIFAQQMLGTNANVNKALEIYTSRYFSTLENTSKIFIPLNDFGHWFLCVINLPQEEVYILDSLPTKRRKKERVDMVTSIISALCLTNLAKYNVQRFPISRPNWVPTQDNGWDCGLYVIRFMQMLDTTPPVSKSSLVVDNSDEFRRKLVIDLVLDDNNKVKQYILNQLNKKP
ncbi:hypothetical protein VitviT2T_020182 [Vitis vinifera]|uniref:Ubiquitin-like protease family profile domain-containing protein n=1 Tax=Vitis vinifera TaxID=29760 RepID=A0ABY9D4R1_VITVI|nr:hypothetical protein VitviT2T_020182 [Vitis vinifera]|eukprot:XP_019079769.1 PREDICTED: uncharacterized protein LOC109123718 isoform X1 [Vitis vinifera]